MREADISLADDIMADGQLAGKMEGFRFVPAPGQSAETEAARAALAAECALRAERFAAAGNGDISIARDGSARWRGRLIAKLKAGEDILRPGFILLADAGLEGEARQKAEARLARFIAFHFETACKPLYDLAAAEALFEKPRFVALKLVEHLGIVPRREIAAPVKELEQESRAALRRLGVRFGVYHIFMPMLLKPAAAEALTLLWGLKHDALEREGYGEVVSCLAAGRTSFAVEERFDRRFYRLAGYRLLGNKAVRIDMLERCADLIRQALAWSPETAAATGARRPEGAYDGRRFTIGQSMLSILGARPEDMEEMLKQLGYAAQSVSAAEYQAFLSGGAAEQEPAPEAEPVGDWSAAAAETEEAAAAVPQAEPVGPKFAAGKTNAALALGAPVLLWRYQKRSHKKPPQREGGRRARQTEQRVAGDEARGGQRRHGGHHNARPQGQDAARKEGGRGETHEGERRFAREGKKREDRRPAGGKFAGGRGEGGKPRHFAGKKHEKPMRAEDSPFAALLALRDKMKK